MSSVMKVPKKLPITTRGLGFITVRFFENCAFSERYRNVNIYHVYRLYLGILEAKLIHLNIACRSSDDEYSFNAEFYKFFDHRNGIIVPDYVAKLINAVGLVTVRGIQYRPIFVADRWTDDGMFVPQSEHVILSNLRRVVEALQDPRTPAVYRRDFYKNNPIPGTIWIGGPEDPLLVNANEIIPEDFAFKRFNHLKLVNYDDRIKTDIISFNAPGDESILICNNQESVRVCDRNENEDLNAYCRRIHIEGNVTEFEWLELMKSDSVITGCMNLVGERPLHDQYMYPYYCIRDTSNCIGYAKISDTDDYINFRNIQTRLQGTELIFSDSSSD